MRYYGRSVSKLNFEDSKRRLSVPVRRYVQLLTKYLRPQWARMLGLSAALLIGIGLQLANPQLLRDFIDGVKHGLPLVKLFWIATGFMVVAIGHQIMSVFNTYLGSNVAWNATNSLRADLAEHCLNLDMSFHKSRTPGELIQRIDGDVAVLGNFFSMFLVQIVGNTVLMIGSLVMLFREDRRVGVILTVFAVTVLVSLSLLRRLAVPFWIRSFQTSAEMFGFLEERLAGTEDVRANGATAYVMRRLYQHMRAYFRTFTKSSLVGSLVGTATRFSFVMAQMLGLGLGAWLYLRGEATIGTVFLISSYVQILQHPIMTLTRQLEDLQRSSASVERVEELLRMESKVKDGPGVDFPQGALSVEFDDVGFAYVESDPVLKGISFELKAGETVGILGRTGSGKTTMTRLLFRLYDPNSGVIRLGGHHISQAKLADLRMRVGMVTQDVQLFHASVRDNLTFFDPGVSDARILEALDCLGLDEWAKSLPKGLDTVLEAGGTGLSAGEAQLLAFTRVFLSDPGLIILDEASSRLDPATEQLIEHAVNRLLENRTGIIVAHRLATVQRVDRILVLDCGQIVEYGLRSELARDPSSRFHSLLQTGLEEALA